MDHKSIAGGSYPAPMLHGLAGHQQHALMYGISLPQVMLESGFRSTSKEALPSILTGFSPLKESDVAQVLGMMAATHSSIELVNLTQRISKSLHIGTGGGSVSPQAATVASAAAADNLSWSYLEFVEIAMEMFPYLNWTIIVQSLDYPEFYVNDLKGVEILVRSFYHATRNAQEFPIYVFCKAWENISGQLSFIRNALLAPLELVMFSKAGRRIIGYEDIEALAAGATRNTLFHLYNQHWNSLELIEFVCTVVETDYFDEVRPVFELASKQCPELLCLGLAFFNPPWNSILREILIKLTTGFLTGQPSSLIVLPRLWRINAQIMLICMTDMHRRDPSCVSRLLDVAQELKILPKMLDAKPHSFAIDMAALASRREHLNLEKWLQDNTREKRDSFLRACLDFISEKCFPQAQRVVMPLSSETLAIFLKVCMAHHALMSYETSELFRELQYGLQSDPGLQALLSAPLLAPSAPQSMAKAAINMEDYNFSEFVAYFDTTFSPDVEEEANSCYEKIYSQEASVNDIIETMTRLKSSDQLRDLKVFSCMVHNLLDEFRFFPKYPEKELTLTGVVFGLLIQRQLIAGPSLGIALRFIYDSLRLPLESKMFKFGFTALMQFQSRLTEWPPICARLLELPSLASFPDLIALLKSALTSSQNARDLANKALHPILAYLPPHAEAALVPEPSLLLAAQADGFPSLKDRLFLDELEGLCSQTEQFVPDEILQDRILFILNNISVQNFDSKLKEMHALIHKQEKYYHWFSEYLVLKRVSIEPNFHSLYLALLDGLCSALLGRHVLAETYISIRALLESEKTVSSSTERTLLKNLGSWLGALTLTRNRPILHKHLPMKELLMEGFEIDRLIVVIPFVCKVLEGCAKSRIFKRNNPWLMNILSLLVELYQFANIKLNLKFEIEVLCKHLQIDLQEIPITGMLKDRSLKYRPTEVAPHALSAAVSGHSPSPIMLAAAGMPGSSAAGLDSLVASIPGLYHFVVMNANNAHLYQSYPIFRKAVLLALEFAIREVASAVIDRSVTIACLTTRELILKDFATEPHDEVMKKAAQQMMQNLTGNLILGTSKEPMRTTILSHLRSFSALAGIDAPDSAFVLIADDHLELACAYVEKAAIEKAIPEINHALASAYAQRRQKDSSAVASLSSVSSSYVYTGSAMVPESLRPTAGGLSSGQLKLYDDFVRISRLQNLANLQIVSIPPLAQADFDRAAVVLRPDMVSTSTPGAASVSISAPPAMPAAAASSGGAPVPASAAAGVPLTTGAVMETFMTYLINIGKIISTHATAAFSSFPSTHELRGLMKQILILALNSTNRDEVCILFSQKIIHILYKTDSILGIEVHVVLLDKLCELSARVTREVTSWVIYAVDERKYNVPVTVAFFLSGLINVLDYDLTLAKHLLNSVATVQFGVALIRRCVLVEPVVAAPVDFLASIAALNACISSPAGELLRLDAGMKKTIGELVSEVEARLVLSQSSLSLEMDEQIAYYFQEWKRLCQVLSAADKSFSSFVHQVFRQGFFREPKLATSFFKTSLQMALAKDHERRSPHDLPDPSASIEPVLSSLECYAKWISFILRCYPANLTLEAATGTTASAKETPCSPASGKSDLLCRFLGTLGAVLLESTTRDSIASLTRLVSSLIAEWHAQERNFEGWLLDFLTVLSEWLHAMRPTLVPHFAFGWLELISHRFFLPKLLSAPDRQGWPAFHGLLLDLLRFVSPFLRGGPMPEPIRVYYKGMLRVFLLILHDFPEFLAAHHWSLCHETPSACIQLRNLVLSAFPRQLKLLDPFTPNLKVDLLPESSQNPLALDDPGTILPPSLRAALDRAIETDRPVEPSKLVDGGLAVFSAHLNAVVYYLGLKAIDMAAAATKGLASGGGPLLGRHLFLSLCQESSPELRYEFLNSLANHLRYPNSHTHYYSSIVLYLFSESSSSELIREQITRVLLERLIVNRPHPWGLLITFIELIKNSQYNFWNHAFTRYSPDIERLFDSVARSCMLPRATATGGGTASSEAPSTGTVSAVAKV